MESKPNPLSKIRLAAAQNHQLFQCLIEFTHRCNLSCKHCYLTGTKRFPEKELTLKQWKHVLDQLAEMQTMFITATGGEFFMRNDAMQILDEFNKRKFVHIILTNGTMITEDVAKELAQKNPFEIHVSILGLEDEHDYISGMQGAFKKTISAIRYMRKEGIKVVAKVIGTQYNMNVLDEMESIAKEEADRYVMTTNLFPPVAGLPSPDEVSICHSDLVELIKNKSSFTGKPKAPDDSAPVCMAGQCIAAISPYGEFFPCVVFRKEIGHVLREKISHIWKSPDMMKIANLKWKDLYKCKGCEEKALCTYCPGKSWLVHGDMCRATEDTCNYTKKVATLWADSDR